MRKPQTAKEPKLPVSSESARLHRPQRDALAIHEVGRDPAPGLQGSPPR